MRICIIIPAHNEEEHLRSCLESFVAQTHIPDQIIVVDDNSTDSTFEIASGFAKKFSQINVVQRKSTNQHVPGKKVVDTFNHGLQFTKDYDLLGKFDADIVLPKNYFETMRNHFQSNWELGMCSGLLYIQKNNTWVYETIADKNHIRGPIKLYLKACFEKMEGLRLGTGWDTVDVLLAQYYGFKTLTDKHLRVKHLRPTGQGYDAKNYRAKGKALYQMRYGIVLAKIALLKMAWQAKNPKFYILAMMAYLNSWTRGTTRFVSKKEGAFIRKQRWAGIFKKLSPKH